MKASLYARMQYVTPQVLPGGWPSAPALYDPKIGMQNLQEGMEKLEFAVREYQIATENLLRVFLEAGDDGTPPAITAALDQLATAINGSW